MPRPSPNLPPPSIPRVIVVEDDEMLLRLISTHIDFREDLMLAGAFLSAESAQTSDQWGDAQALLCDLELPGASGVDLIRWTRKHHPHVQVAVHTSHSESALILEAIKAGATGYLLKSGQIDQLSSQIHWLLNGKAPLSPEVAMIILQHLGTNHQNLGAELLSSRELSILKLLAAGDSYKIVGDKLGISPHTVHSHVKRIYPKIDASSKKQAMHNARLRGLV